MTHGDPTADRTGRQRATGGRAMPLAPVLMLCGLLALVGGGRPAHAAQCPAPAGPTDPQSCVDLWRPIGLPVSNNDERACQHTIVCHTGYLLRHNNLTRTPDWVIEHLTRERVEQLNTRPDVDFSPEPEIPEAGRALDKDYLRSGYARGHQAASADFAFDDAWMQDTFFFSNSVPQVGGKFNSSIWSQFEKRVRRIATERGEIHVITGPIYAEPDGSEIVIPAEQNNCGNEIRLPAPRRKLICGGTSDGPTLDCPEGVAIPAALFKIIIDGPGHRVNAYILPNRDHLSGRERGTSTARYLRTWRVTVLNVEERTGYDFLPDLDRHDQIALEEQCPATMIR